MDLPLPAGDKRTLLATYIGQMMAPGTPLAGMSDAMLAGLPEDRRAIVRRAWERAMPVLQAELFDLFSDAFDDEEIAWSVAVATHPMQARVNAKLAHVGPRVGNLVNAHIAGVIAQVRAEYDTSTGKQ